MDERCVISQKSEMGEVVNIVYGENIRVLVQLWHNSLSGVEMKIILAPRKVSYRTGISRGGGHIYSFPGAKFKLV